MKPSKKTVTGEVCAIKYRSADGWAVFSLAGQPFQCTGVLSEMVDVGSEVTCSGTIEDGKFGRQLKCEQIVPAAPDISTAAGVAKLLQRLPGIGPKKAMQAVIDYGHEMAWNYALTDPTQIGVHPDNADAAMQIAEGLLASYDATVYLLGIGLTDHQAATIYKVFGANSVEIVSRDPYKLLQIDGFGFITVDKIALKAGIAVNNPSRISACILYVLDDSAINGGHIYHSGWKLAETVLEILSQTAMKSEVPLLDMPDIEQVRQQVHYLQAEEKIHINKGKVFSRDLLRAEESILDFMGVEHAA